MISRRAVPAAALLAVLSVPAVGVVVALLRDKGSSRGPVDLAATTADFVAAHPVGYDEPITLGGDRVLAFSRHLSPTRPVSEGRREGRLELPADARLVRSLAEPSCVRDLWRSPTLTGETGGTAAGALVTLLPGDGRAVTKVTVEEVTSLDTPLSCVGVG